MLLIPTGTALEFQASLVYIASFRTEKATK